MNTELQQKLFQEFPILFNPNQNMNHGLMGFGFECGDGWYNLIRDLSEKLYPLVKEFNDSQDEDGYICEAVQVKEKYGTLRFYLSSQTDEMSNLIDEYEKLSARICESCGLPGKLDNSNYWVRTRCEEHGCR